MKHTSTALAALVALPLIGLGVGTAQAATAPQGQPDAAVEHYCDGMPGKVDSDVTSFYVAFINIASNRKVTYRITAPELKIDRSYTVGAFGGDSDAFDLGYGKKAHLTVKAGATTLYSKVVTGTCRSVYRPSGSLFTNCKGEPNVVSAWRQSTAVFDNFDSGQPVKYGLYQSGRPVEYVTVAAKKTATRLRTSAPGRTDTLVIKAFLPTGVKTLATVHAVNTGATLCRIGKPNAEFPG